MLALLRCAVIFLNLCLCLPLGFCQEPAAQETSNSNCASGGQLCLDYHKALDRYAYLKKLEDTQSWDDYFANGNTYRQEIEENAEKVISLAQADNPLRLKSRLLLWQFHNGQQDAFVGQALTDLITDTQAYAKETEDTELIKNVADTLLANEEKSAARQIYKLYVDKLVAGQTDSSVLKSAAAAFYKEGNLDLAQSVYDIYIEKVSKELAPEQFTRQLFEIASLFVYKGQGLYDMAYAEKIYQKLESLGQENIFNQETIYLRAFNLEKFKDYEKANKYYLQLTQDYPDTKYFDEAVYKIAVINVYALGNLNAAKKHFEMLATKTVFSPQVISSLYQLGLLAQWEGDLVKAKDNYAVLLKNSAKNYPETLALAQERLKEIQENKEISYNLKTFLDSSLKNENALSEMGKAELKSPSYILTKGQKTTISSLVNMPQSGCNQVQLQYLWSGDLGGVNPPVSDESFQCAYTEPGTKIINIVIISPLGAADRSFLMIDVY